VTKILNRFVNRIKIEGAVFRPDTYAFYEGMRISDLILKADGLEDAYNKRARILKKIRLNNRNYCRLRAGFKGNLESDIALYKEDVVTVYSILDFVEEYKVTIDGEIKTQEFMITTKV
jgi:protein involved in polysaccharide export with SLBB domain